MGRIILTVNCIENLLITKEEKIRWLLFRLGIINDLTRDNTKLLLFKLDDTYDLTTADRRLHYWDCQYLKLKRDEFAAYRTPSRDEWVGMRARVSPKHLKSALDRIEMIVELRDLLGYETNMHYALTAHDRWHVATVERSNTWRRIAEQPRRGSRAA